MQLRPPREADARIQALIERSHTLAVENKRKVYVDKPEFLVYHWSGEAAAFSPNTGERINGHGNGRLDQLLIDYYESFKNAAPIIGRLLEWAIPVAMQYGSTGTATTAFKPRLEVCES